MKWCYPFYRPSIFQVNWVSWFPLVSFFPLFPVKILWCQWLWFFLQTGCPCCHAANTIKAVKKTQYLGTGYLLVASVFDLLDALSAVSLGKLGMNLFRKNSKKTKYSVDQPSSHTLYSPCLCRVMSFNHCKLHTLLQQLADWIRMWG